MYNELIFLLHLSFIALSCLAAAIIGRSALITFISCCCILSNMFVLKQITLLGLTATASDPFTIGATLGINFLQEYYRKEAAMQAIRINFFSLIFYTALCLIHLAYQPTLHDQTHALYHALFWPMPRILIASISAYMISQLTDYYLYGWFKKMFVTRGLVFRNYGSMAISQLIDTITFSFLGLYGLVDSIGSIIIVSYSIKLFAVFLTAPFIRLSAHLVAQHAMASKPMQFDEAVD